MRTFRQWSPVLVLIGLAGCGKSGGSLDADLKYLPADCQAIGSAKVGDILASQSYKDFIAEMAKAGSKEDPAVEFKEHVGLNLADITSATFGVDGSGDGTLVLHMAKPVSAAEIIKNLKPRPGFVVVGSKIGIGPDGKVEAPPPPKVEPRKFKEEKVGSYTIHEEDAPFGGMTFCVASPSTVILGEAKVLRAVLQRDKQAVLADGLKKALELGSQSGTAWVALDVKSASKKLPPPAPQGGDPTAALQQSAGDVDAAFIEANLGKDSSCAIKLLCQDGAKATKLKGELDKLVPLARLGMGDLARELGPMGVALTKPLGEILDSTRIEASGAKVSVQFKGNPVLVALTAIQLLGTQATTTFEEVGQAIGTAPVVPPPSQK